MEVEVDLSTINDEEELRRMWLQADDFGRKKEIRKHLYNLREARLADYYNTEEEPIITTKTTTTIMSSTKTNVKSPVTPSHGDSLADQSFQSFKSKEIRDSESPTPEFKFIQQQKLKNIDGVIVPDTSGWNIQSSKEIAPDGSGFRNETLATTEGSQKIDGGQVQFAGKNEHMQRASHHGDDKNFVKTAAESSNTHLQESSVVGDENSGRIEKKSSSVITSTSKHVESKQSSFGDGDFDDHFKNLSLEDKLRMTRRNNTDSSSSIFENRDQRHVEKQERQHFVDHQNQVQHQEHIQRQQKSERQEQIEQQHIQEQQRRVKSVSSNVDERYMTTVHNTDGTTYKKSGTINEDSPPELQNKLKELQAQPGRLISRKIEYPKPNVVMIVETKELPDGTVVTTKNYETKSATTAVESKEQQRKVVQESREFSKVQNKQQITRDETDRVNNAVNKNRTNVNTQNEREIYEAEFRNEQERDWKRGTDSIDRNRIQEDVEVFDTRKTVKKDLSQTMRKQNITQQDFIETDSGCVMIDRNQPRSERYIVDSNDSTDRIHKQSYTSVNEDHVKCLDNRSKPDFTTHGFPSVAPGHSTNEPNEQHPHYDNPILHKQMSQHFHGTHGFPSVVDRSDTVSETSEHYETRSETVQRSSQDFTTHGFPSTRSPTKESRPAAGKPSYIQKSVPKEVSDDFRGTHGFPSVVDRDDFTQKTENYKTQSEVYENVGHSRPAAGKPSYTKTVIRDDTEDFRGTHGFPSVIEKKTKNIEEKNVEKKVVETEYRSSSESLSRQKKTDAAHDAFARSLRSQSPVDTGRRSSNSSRNRCYSPQREASNISESSRHSSTTINKGRGSTPTKKTKEIYHSNETIDLPQGGVQKNSTSKTYEEYTGEPIKKVAATKLNRLNKKPLEPVIIKEKFDDRFVGLNEVIEVPIVKKTVTKLCPDGCPLPKSKHTTHTHEVINKTGAKPSMKSPMIKRQLLQASENKPKVLAKTTLATAKKPIKVNSLVKSVEKKLVPKTPSTKILSKPTISTKLHVQLDNKEDRKNFVSPKNRISSTQTKRVISSITSPKLIPSKLSNISPNTNSTNKHTITVTSHYLNPTESSRHHIEDNNDSICKDKISLHSQSTKFKPIKSRSPNLRPYNYYFDAPEPTKHQVKKTTQNFLDMESKRIPRHQNIGIEIIDFKKIESQHSNDNFEEIPDESFSKTSSQIKQHSLTTHSDKIKPYTIHGQIPYKPHDGYVSKKTSIELTKDYKDIDDSKVTYPNYISKDKTTKDITTKSGSTSPTRSPSRSIPASQPSKNTIKNDPSETINSSSPKPRKKLPSKSQVDNIEQPDNRRLSNENYEKFEIEQNSNITQRPKPIHDEKTPQHELLTKDKTITTDLDSDSKLIENVNTRHDENIYIDVNEFNTKAEPFEPNSPSHNQYIPRSMAEEYAKESQKDVENDSFYLTRPMDQETSKHDKSKINNSKTPFNRSETFEERCRDMLGINESTTKKTNVNIEDFISTERNFIEENTNVNRNSDSSTYKEQSVSPTNQNKQPVEKTIRQTTTTVDVQKYSTSPTNKDRSVSPDIKNKKYINEPVFKPDKKRTENQKAGSPYVNLTYEPRSISPEKDHVKNKITTTKKNLTDSIKITNVLETTDTTKRTLPNSKSKNVSPERNQQKIPDSSKSTKHITSTHIEITPTSNKSDNIKSVKRNQSPSFEINGPRRGSNQSPEKNVIKKENEEIISITTKTTKQAGSPKKPVTERKESAPIYRENKVDRDQKMSRSTSDSILKVNQNRDQNNVREQRKNSEKKDLKNTVRPQKCLATKTITVTDRSSIINSEDIENVIIDIHLAKSSREPSPNKIVPVPVPLDEDTGLPRYPDKVQEPEDNKRKPKVNKVPIFEEETNDYVGCQITEVDNEMHHEKIKYNKNKNIENDEGRLINVRDDVTKIINKTGDKKKPFHLDLTNDSEEDDYQLSVSDKVNKFLSTAEELTRDIISYKSKEILNSKQESVNIETNECNRTNKICNITEKLIEAVPQKSPELVKKIVRQISQPNETDNCRKSNITAKKISLTNITISEKPKPLVKHLPESKSKPIIKNDNVKQAKLIFQNQDKKNITTDSGKLRNVDIDRKIEENISNRVKKTREQDLTNKSYIKNNVINKKNIFESYSVTSKNDISSKAQNVTDRLTSTTNRESRRPSKPSSIRAVPKSPSPISTLRVKTSQYDQNRETSQSKISNGTPISKVTPRNINEKSPTKLGPNRQLKSSPNRMTETVTTSTTITKRVSPTRESLYYGEFGDNCLSEPYKERSRSPSKVKSDDILKPEHTHKYETINFDKSTNKNLLRKDQKLQEKSPVRNIDKNPKFGRTTESPGSERKYSAGQSPVRSPFREPKDQFQREPKDVNNAKDFDEYLLISKNINESSVLTRKKLFETADGINMNESQKPSYMDHTKASLEHIRRDSLEINRNNINRKTSVDEEYSEFNPRAVKFGVELKHKDEQAPKRKTSSPDIPHIEEIFDLELLEEILSTVVGYEHRRRVRAQIRIVKNMMKQKKQEEAQIAYIRETSPARRSSPSRESTPTITSAKRRESIKSYNTSNKNESSYTKQKVQERSISPRSKIDTVTTVTKVTRVGNEKPKISTYTTSGTTIPSNDKPVWASKNILKKATTGTVTNITKKPATVVKAKLPIRKDVDDDITSSYGIGPTDDDGKPIFGIRALKKKSNQTTESNKVTGTVVSESFYSENGEEPIGQRTVTVYSSEPKDIDDYETKHKFRGTNDSIHSIRSQKDGVTTVTSTQKYSSKSNIGDKSIYKKEVSPIFNRRGSVKETNEKFIRKESSSTFTEKSTSSSNYPTDLIIEHRSRSKSPKKYYEGNDDVSEDECESVNIIKTVNKSTKSFLNSAGSKVTDVNDVLDRMRNADNVVEDGDTMEDQEARALLNKFLGASVLMTGIEKVAPSTFLSKETIEVVKAPVIQEKVETRITKIIKTEGGDTSIPITLDEIGNIEEIWDEELLKELLEKSTNYEDRRKIRARLRQLMAEREACADYVAGVKTQLQNIKSSKEQDDIDSDSSCEYEEIIEEIEVTDDSDEYESAPLGNVMKTPTTPTKISSPNIIKPTIGSGIIQINQNTKVVADNKSKTCALAEKNELSMNKSDTNNKNEEGDKLLPLLQDILNKNINMNNTNNSNNKLINNNNINKINNKSNNINNNSSSSSKMPNIKSSNSRQLKQNNAIQHYIEDSGTESGEDLRLLAAGLRDSMQSISNQNSNLIEEVTMALSRLEQSLKKGKDIEVDQMKRVALLNLVERLQTGLTSPDKILPPTPAPTTEDQSDQNGNRQKFAKRKNRANRHTVGVSREELADARRYMEEMVMMETLSNCTTPESSSITPKAESSFPIQKQNSAIIISKTNEQSRLYRPNQFVPNKLKDLNSKINQEQVVMREKKPTVCDAGKRNSANLEQINNGILSNGKRPLSESYAPNFNDVQNCSYNNYQASPALNFNSVPQNYNIIYNKESSGPKEISEEVLSQNQIAINRFNKKAAMKRANTIDIPKPMKYLSEMDSDSEAEEHGINSTKSFGLRGTVQVTVKHKPKQVVPTFQPKTENDLKFLAFIQKQGPSPSLGWNNPNRTVNNWTNKFSNLKNSFESSASNTSAKPPVPNSTAKNFWKKNDQGHTVSSAKVQGIKPPWVDKNFTSELNDAKAQQIAHIPKPVPLNKFSHASQSVFKPVDLVPQPIYQQQQFKPIQPDPRLHQSEPQLNQNSFYSEKAPPPPNYTWTTLTSAPNSPRTVQSPTKIWMNKHSAPASPNPTNQLPWSTKNKATNRIRDKAEKYDKRSPPPVKLHRHNSLRTAQEEEKSEYKRPSLPNTADPYNNPTYMPNSYHHSNPQLNISQTHHYHDAKIPFLPPSFQNSLPYQSQKYQPQMNVVERNCNPGEINISRRYREDSLTNPSAEPLVLTNWNPTFNTDASANHQAPLTIFDYPSPIESLGSPSQTYHDPLDSLTSPSRTYHDLTDDDTENIEYKAETRVMTGPIGQQAITVGNKTHHVAINNLQGKKSNEAESLLSVMKNINGKNTENKKSEKSSVQSTQGCLSPDGRNYVAPNVEPIYPDFSSLPQNRMPVYDGKQKSYEETSKLVRLNSLEQKNMYHNIPGSSQVPTTQIQTQIQSELQSEMHPQMHSQMLPQMYSQIQPQMQPQMQKQLHYQATSNYPREHQLKYPSPENQRYYTPQDNEPRFDPNPVYVPPKPLAYTTENTVQYANQPVYQIEHPQSEYSQSNPVYKAEKTKYINISEAQSRKTIKTKRSEDSVMIESHQLPNVTNQQAYQSVQPKIQSEHTKELNNYSKLEKNLNQHRQINKTYKKSEHLQQQQVQEMVQYETNAQSTTETTETKNEDGVTVTTTKVTTRTVTGTPTIISKTVSPFAKFKQLDKQNSQNTPNTPSTPGTSSSKTPIFTFTDPAVAARAATAKDILLQWCQMKTAEYENIQITNFSTSWNDGMAFCALIHHFLPDAFDFSKLTPKQRRYNFTLAFRVADEQAGIAPLLDVEDMVVMKRPDWKCVFTYVQTIYRHFRNCQ